MAATAIARKRRIRLCSVEIGRPPWRSHARRGIPAYDPESTPERSAPGDRDEAHGRGHALDRGGSRFRGRDAARPRRSSRSWPGSRRPRRERRRGPRRGRPCRCNRCRAGSPRALWSPIRTGQREADVGAQCRAAPAGSRSRSRSPSRAPSKATKKPSPVELTTSPPPAATRARSMSSCLRRTASQAWSPRASARLVEPTMSVNMKVLRGRLGSAAPIGRRRGARARLPRRRSARRAGRTRRAPPRARDPRHPCRRRLAARATGSPALARLRTAHRRRASP